MSSFFCVSDISKDYSCLVCIIFLLIILDEISYGTYSIIGEISVVSPIFTKDEDLLQLLVIKSLLFLDYFITVL